MKPIPFGLALRFNGLTSIPKWLESSIQARTFLLLCVTQIIQSRPTFDHILGQFLYDFTMLFLVLKVLFWTKEEVCLLAESAVILISSYVVNSITLSVVLGMGDISLLSCNEIYYLSTFYNQYLHDYFAALNLENICIQSWKTYTESFDQYGIILTCCVFYFIQGGLAKRLTSHFVGNPDGYETEIIHGSFGLPLLTGFFLSYKKRLNYAVYNDYFEVACLICPAISSLGLTLDIPKHSNLYNGRKSFSMFRSLVSGKGFFFTLKYLFLRAVVVLKYIVRSNELIATLRIYWLIRLLSNISEVLLTGNGSISEIVEAVLYTSCQDGLSVIASSSILSKVIQLFNAVLMSPGMRYGMFTHSTDLTCFIYIVLGYINMSLTAQPWIKIGNWLAISLFSILCCSRFITASAFNCYSNKEFKHQPRHLWTFLAITVLSMLPIVIYDNGEIENNDLLQTILSLLSTVTITNFSAFCITGILTTVISFFPWLEDTRPFISFEFISTSMIYLYDFFDSFILEDDQSYQARNPLKNGVLLLNAVCCMIKMTVASYSSKGIASEDIGESNSTMSAQSMDDDKIPKVIELKEESGDDFIFHSFETIGGKPTMTIQTKNKDTWICKIISEKLEKMEEYNEKNSFFMEDYVDEIILEDSRKKMSGMAKMKLYSKWFLIKCFCAKQLVDSELVQSILDIPDVQYHQNSYSLVPFKPKGKKVYGLKL